MICLDSREYLLMSGNSMTTHFFELKQQESSGSFMFRPTYDRSVDTKLRVLEEFGIKDPQPYICFRSTAGMLAVILLQTGQVVQLSLLAQPDVRLNQNCKFKLAY